MVIDDVQRIPELLNEVHRLTETKRTRLILTSSSAWRIRDGGVNHSVGCAQTRYLPPFTCRELGTPFALVRAIQRGGSPRSTSPKDTRIIHEGPAWRSSAERKPFPSSNCDFLRPRRRIRLADNFTERDLRPLPALAEEKKLDRYLCICYEPRPSKIGVMEVVQYGDSLAVL